MQKISQVAAGYMLCEDTQYICADCVAYDPDSKRCLYLGPSDVVLPFDGCNLFLKGEPESIVPKEGMGQDRDGDSAMSLITPACAGFMNSNFGFGCKRCGNFGLTNDCKIVEGFINIDGCCNAWVPGPKANLPAEAI